MIPIADCLDLGRDKERMKDPNDALRQTATVSALLDRFFARRQDDRFEIQTLADEVGMGKTFVALGVAYSILLHLKSQSIHPDLGGCYQRILVLTPDNRSLFSKWVREVAEFAKRCVIPGHGDNGLHFAPRPVERIDELAAALRKPGRQPQVLVARMNVCRGRLKHYDLKRRFLLGVLFRFWGNRFDVERRNRLLRGAPEGWPKSPYDLTQVEPWELDVLPFDEKALLGFLEGLRGEDEERVDQLLSVCREISQSYYRDRQEAFGGIETKLVEIYKSAVAASIARDFPLLIIDEAHHWKNGPLQGTNGFGDFSEYLAPHSRRALLLTATPFQLRPQEMLEVLKVSDSMKFCSTLPDSGVRRDRLTRFREDVIRPVLANSENHSRSFSKAWAKLPQRIETKAIEEIWQSDVLRRARRDLLDLASEPGVVSRQDSSLIRIIEAALAGIDPDVRHFLREALRLYAYNADLSRELGRLIIRHRRRTEHRLCRIGGEYEECAGDAARRRPDRHVLHVSAGLDVRGEAELPQYLLMRCVSEMKAGRGKSSLGSDLTGCYSTLLESAEGRTIRQLLDGSPRGRMYLDLLHRMVNEKQDPKHPKLAKVVEDVLEKWRRGEKVLIFCFRVKTANRVQEILRDRIRADLEEQRRRCLGGAEQFKTLRARLTGRGRDLIGLGLDRVLWSCAWAVNGSGPPWTDFTPEWFKLTDGELDQLARLGLQFGVELKGERVDRVFLCRAVEHILATRLRSVNVDDRLRELVERIASLEWVSHPYGLDHKASADVGQEEKSEFDERGVHTVYKEGEVPQERVVAILAAELAETRRRAGDRALVDAYARAPSLWLGSAPAEAFTDGGPGRQGIRTTIEDIHKRLFGLTVGPEGLDLESRAMVAQALRRAVLRESVLLRLLPNKTERDEAGWGELLTQAFFRPLQGQHESMADRIAVFLEDLNAASGTLQDVNSSRYALFDATKLRDQQFVAIVKGGGGGQGTRERVFMGFNTPLLPEVLVCTSVGQEGIDLHRHCRHVVHYDLAWNPAVLEQRTGRVDRIGSKTFRERGAAGGDDVFLDIGVPFLAGTYDERMYEELRLRAQTFEVLTGGDYAADHADGLDDERGAEGRPLGLSIVALPRSMLEELRVDLQVWRPGDEEVRSVESVSSGIQGVHPTGDNARSEDTTVSSVSPQFESPEPA